MNIVRVAVAGPFFEPLDYLVPEPWPMPPVGARVWLEVRHKEQVGVVVAWASESHVPASKLKWVLRLIDSVPLFDERQRTFLAWLASYYHAPLGEIYQLAMPALLRSGTDLSTLAIPLLALTAEAKALSAAVFRNAPKQAFIWQALQQAALPRAQLMALGASSAALKSLVDKGWIEVQSQAVPEPPVHFHPALTANEAQQQAIEAVRQALGHYHALVLFGVTGSGKTEVYLQSIALVVAQAKQALVLVPEIGLTPQTVARFQARFGEAALVVLHSGLTEKQRLAAWLAAQSGRAKIVIGTRSAIFVPFQALALIVVDEEHDRSFKQQEGIRYNARDAAIVRAHQLGIPVLLGSATPSLETWLNVDKQRYQLWRLPCQALQSQTSTWQLIDLRHQAWQDGLATVLVEAMRETLARGEQVLLFLNRRGFSVSLLCHQCGWSPHCSRCDTPLSCHKEPLKLACHHCGYQTQWRYRCKSCHYTLAPVGTGTQRVAETLKRLFPAYPVLRIDRDSTKSKGSFEAMLDTIYQGQAQILLGTQMLAKGHHFPKVTLVGILNADSGLYSGDFRATEHLAQLMVQVAGRAGRADKPGTVWIQTLWPDHPLWQQLLRGGYETFLSQALAERDKAALPPYRFVALIGAESKAEQRALTFLTAVRDFLQQQALVGIKILGPVPAVKEKRAGFYRAQLWVQSAERRLLSQAIDKVQHYYHAHPEETRKVRHFLDIDPYHMD